MLPFMDTTTQASAWTLFGLLLLPLLLCLRRRVILAGDQKFLPILSQWQLRKQADKGHGNKTEQQLDLPKTVAGFLQRDLFGMDIYEDKVLEFLDHGAPSLLGISGARGLGKSTLLSLILNNHFYTGRGGSFDYTFYLEVGGNGFTVPKFQDALARRMGLGHPPSHMSIDIFAKTISNRLKDESFLLMMDDVRDAIDLSAIGLPMPLGRRQKVVFTTRDRAICIEMGCTTNDIIEMQCLGEDVAWELFKYHVGVGDEVIKDNSTIQNIAEKMVAECRGIPGALCTIGRCMSNKSDLFEWVAAYGILMTKRPLPLQEMTDVDYLEHFEDELR